MSRRRITDDLQSGHEGQRVDAREVVCACAQSKYPR